MLEPVRESWRSGKSLVWTRVHDLPDFAYFDHSIHVAKGVGCTTCHGPIDQMALTYQASSLQMEWCLACHRAPEKFLRPKSEVFNVKWEAPSKGKPVTFENQKFEDQIRFGLMLKNKYGVRPKADLTSCSTCHR